MDGLKISRKIELFRLSNDPIILSWIMFENLFPHLFTISNWLVWIIFLSLGSIMDMYVIGYRFLIIESTVFLYTNDIGYFYRWMFVELLVIFSGHNWKLSCHSSILKWFLVIANKRQTPSHRLIFTLYWKLDMLLQKPSPLAVFW